MCCHTQSSLSSSNVSNRSWCGVVGIRPRRNPHASGELLVVVVALNVGLDIYLISRFMTRSLRVPSASHATHAFDQVPCQSRRWYVPTRQASGSSFPVSKISPPTRSLSSACVNGAILQWVSPPPEQLRCCPQACSLASL